MKTDRQYRDSAAFSYIGWAGIIIVLLISLMISCTENTQQQYNTLTSQDSLELIEPDAIYYDTIQEEKTQDSIEKYMRDWYEYLDTNSNGDIDDTEMDCGGSDEYVMWLTGEGDTIWE